MDTDKLPRCSVVICVYNEARLLRDALNSLVNQACSDNTYEIIVVDDESTDASPEICRDVIREREGRLPDLGYVRIAHAGLACARNVGIHRARGHIIAFMDADATAAPNWVSSLCQTLENNRADYTGGRIELLNGTSRFASLLHHTRHAQILDGPPYRNHFIGCNMAIRHSLVERIGGFAENFDARGDEVAFQLAAGQAGGCYAPSSDAVVYHERPSSPAEWLLTEWREKMLLGLIRKVDGFPLSHATLVRHACKQAFLASPPLVIAVACWCVYALWLLVPWLPLFLYEVFGRQPRAAAHRSVRGRYGNVAGLLLWAGYKLLDYGLSAMGLFWGLFRYSGVSIVAPGTTTVTTFQETSTRHT